MRPRVLWRGRPLNSPKGHPACCSFFAASFRQLWWLRLGEVALPEARGRSDCRSRRVQGKSERWKEMSAQRFLNTAFGVSNGGLAAWGVAGGAAYYFFYLPEKEKADAEVLRAANAERLMKQKNYVEFVKEHEAKQTKAGKGGWFGGWFGGKKQ